MKIGLRLGLATLAIAATLALGLTAAGFAAPGPTVRAVLPATEAGGGLAAGEVLVGTRKGLERLSVRDRSALPLWSGGEVRKILRPAKGEGWFFLTSVGIFYSRDLATFEDRSAGLPVKTYKRIVEGRKTFERLVMDLKDLESDPSGLLLVACTKDEAWLSRDGGLTWNNYGSPSGTTGLKCVALAPPPGGGENVLYASHPISGLYLRKLAPGSKWTPVQKGLYVMPTMKSPDEIADLLWVPAADLSSLTTPTAAAAAGAPGPSAAKATTATSAAAAAAGTARQGGVLWASNSFQAKVYRAAGAGGEFTQVYDDGSDFGTAESLAALPDGSIRFVTDGRILRLDPAAPWAASEDGGPTYLAKAAAEALGPEGLLSLGWYEAGAPATLSELWLVAGRNDGALRREAAGKNALYLQAGYVVDPAHRAFNFHLVEERGLNALVVDLKDDYGRLRYSSRDPAVRALGRSSNPLDVETFAAEAKARGIWLVARIPVFKDESLANAAGGRFAVWDAAAKAPWQGWRTEKKSAAAQPAPPPPGIPGLPPAAPAAPPPAPERVYYGERWVDPYSEEVWAYNVAIANEIIARGFDEIQFDYIRFPTDGENLQDAAYRWKDPGMDKESAIASFLAFARERITSPISIDIYGANGWYRSAARTGQDVELLAKYVDVICPMLYPSHFEQGFLAQAPAVDRPLRIYRLGSLRNARIARDRVIVRPYVQAFYMNVSYDRAYYNADYVTREVQGVLEGQNLGMTFWNNVDRYDEVPFLTRSPSGALVMRSPAATAATAATAASAAAVAPVPGTAPSAAQRTSTAGNLPAAAPVTAAGSPALGATVEGKPPLTPEVPAAGAAEVPPGDTLLN